MSATPPSGCGIAYTFAAALFISPWCRLKVCRMLVSCAIQAGRSIRVTASKIFSTCSQRTSPAIARLKRFIPVISLDGVAIWFRFIWSCTRTGNFAVLVASVPARSGNFGAGLAGWAGGDIGGVFVGAGQGCTGGIAESGVGLCRVDGADLIFGLLVFLAVVLAVSIAGWAGEITRLRAGRAVSAVAERNRTAASGGHG